MSGHIPGHSQTTLFGRDASLVPGFASEDVPLGSDAVLRPAVSSIRVGRGPESAVVS